MDTALINLYRRFICLLVALVAFCSVSNALGTKIFMSKAAKDLYKEISTNYEWTTMSSIIDDDIKTLSSYMNNGDNAMVSYLKQFDIQSHPIDLYWNAEKESLKKSYGDKISKLNKMQRNLLYEELNRDIQLICK